LAADDVMANYFGNTIVAPGGVMTPEIHTHYRADHTFDLVGSQMGMSKTFHGTWAIKGDEVCRTFVGEQPPNAPSPFCTPIVSHKVGETWTSTPDKNGNTRTVKLVAGVQ
jgi:hypothetical protein